MLLFVVALVVIFDCMHALTDELVDGYEPVSYDEWLARTSVNFVQNKYYKTSIPNDQCRLMMNSKATGCKSSYTLLQKWYFSYHCMALCHEDEYKCIRYDELIVNCQFGSNEPNKAFNLITWAATCICPNGTKKHGETLTISETKYEVMSQAWHMKQCDSPLSVGPPGVHNCDPYACTTSAISWCDKYASCQTEAESMTGFECSCASGYVGNGFECSKICNVPKINNAISLTSTEGYLKEGEIIMEKINFTVICENAFKLVGDPVVECTSFGLSDQPVCKATCKRPSLNNARFHTVENVSSDTFEEFLEDMHFQVTCDDGFLLSGEPCIDCMPDGTWSPADQQCLEACHYTQPEHPHSLVTYLDGCNASSPVVRGEQLKLTCDEGYSLNRQGETVATLNCLHATLAYIPECFKVCVPPDSPNLIKDTSETVLENGFVRFSCPPTHKYTEEDQCHICLSNGNFKPPVGRCLRKCNIPEAENGQWSWHESRNDSIPSGSVIVEDTLIFLQCLPHYRLDGDMDHAFCLTNGTLSSTGNCVWECAIPIVENGQFLTADFSEVLQDLPMTGEAVTLECADGHIACLKDDTTCTERTQSRQIDCLPEGNLDQNECRRFCEFPDLAFLEPPATGSFVLVDEVATFTCEDPRVYYGTNSHKCLPSGKFEGPLGRCSVTCLVPMLPNGLIHADKETVPRISVSGSTVEEGTILYYSCNSDAQYGFQQTRSEILSTFCDSTGNIDLSEGGDCVWYCALSLSHNSYGQYYINLNLDVFPYNSIPSREEVRFECNSGYIMCKPEWSDCDGDTSVICMDGENFAETCMKICDLPVIPGLIMNEGVIVEGDVTAISCTDDYIYSLADNTHLCTTDGYFDPPLGYCRRKCDVPTIANGFLVDDDINEYTLDKFVEGAAVTLKCNDGYRLAGTRCINCLPDGTISPTPGTCEKLCPLVNIKDGQLMDSAGLDFAQQAPMEGESLKMKCDEGFRACSSTILYCDPLEVVEVACINGQMIIPECKTFCTVPSIQHSEPESPFYVLSETVVTMACETNYGYDKTSRKTFSCQDDGNFDDVNFGVCKAICIIPYNGDAYRTITHSEGTLPVLDGEYLTISCSNNYEMIGNSVLTCGGSGNFDTSLPECKAICDPISNVANGNVVYATPQYKEDSSLSVFCDTNYKLNDDRDWFCDHDRTWDGYAQPNVLCERLCPIMNILHLAHVYTTKQITEGESIALTCDANYHYDGETLTCLSTGLFDEIYGQCIRICTAPTTDNLASPSSDSYNDESDIKFTCEDTYYHMGNATRKCQSDGTFDGVESVCKKICDIPDDVDTNLNINADTPILEGESVFPNCSSDVWFELVGATELVCTSEGKFDNHDNDHEYISVDTTFPYCRPKCSTNIKTPFRGNYTLSDEYYLDSVLEFSCDERDGNDLKAYEYRNSCNKYICKDTNNWEKYDDDDEGCTHYPNLTNHRGNENRLSVCEGHCGSIKEVNELIDNGKIGVPAEFANDTWENRTQQFANETWENGTRQFANALEYATFLFANAVLENDTAVQAQFANGVWENDTITIKCLAYSYQNASRDQTCNENGELEPKTQCIPLCADLETTEYGLIISHNRSYNGTMSQYGDIASFSCVDGYWLNGTTYGTCDKANKWVDDAGNELDLPLCDYICGNMTVPNGNTTNYSDDRKLETHTASYECNTQFEKQPEDDEATCVDGGWQSGSGKWCRAVCYLPEINNAIIDPELGYIFIDEIASYTCEQDYHMVGTKSDYSCTHNVALDTAIQFTCERICYPSDPTNGNFNIATEPMLETETVNYNCDANFVLVGHSSLICESTGSLSGDEPLCLVFCNVEILDNGKAEYEATDTKHEGSKIFYNCCEGYFLYGNAEASCGSDRNWDDKPICKISCPEPSAVVNGTYSGGPYYDGIQVTYTCNSDSYNTGDETITCLPDGSYSSGLAVCDLTCPTPVTIANSAPAVFQEPILSGNTVVYSCLTQYYLSGEAVKTCKSDGKYDFEDPTCLIICDQMGAVVNGVISYSDSNRIESSTITITCDNGYHLLGDASGTCLPTGIWSIPSPECRIECPTPTTFPDSSFTPGPYYEGVQVTYTCDANHVNLGANTLDCGSNGAYDGGSEYIALGNPNCIIYCPIPTTTDPNLLITDDPPVILDETVTFACPTGYWLDGSDTVTCLSDGTYDESFPSCIILCDTPDPIVNGQISYSDPIIPNVALTYGCDSSYFLFENDTRTCQSDGTYDIGPPRCIICPAGWTLTNHSCYKYIGQEQEPDRAELNCTAENSNARLPIFRKAEDLSEFTTAIIEPLDNELPYRFLFTHLGGSDAKVENTWLVSGDPGTSPASCPSRFSDWGSDSPSDVSMRKNCLVLRKLDGKMEDVSCTSVLRETTSLICQIPHFDACGY